METRIAQVSSLRVGGYVIFDDVACSVKSIQSSRPGKHGHAKCRIEAVGIRNGKKIIKVMPSHDKVDVPVVEKKAAQILSITGSMANVMDLETYETFDLEIPEELKDQLSEGRQILYWTVLGVKIMKQLK